MLRMQKWNDGVDWIVWSVFRRILYYGTEPNQVIVLEDICERGYYTLPATLDFKSATKAAAKLARFHAASYHLYYDVSRTHTIVQLIQMIDEKHR